MVQKEVAVRWSSVLFIHMLALILFGTAACGNSAATYDTPVPRVTTDMPLQQTPLTSPTMSAPELAQDDSPNPQEKQASPTIALATKQPATPTLTLTATSALTSSDILSESLVLWTSEQGRALEVVRELASAFAAQHDRDITVVAKNADSLRVDVIANALVGNASPHLIWGNQDDLAALLHDGNVQPVAPVGEHKEFVPVARIGATQDGLLWGYPLTLQDFLLLLYNRRCVSAPPNTTDELIVQSRAVQNDAQNGCYGLVAGWSQARWFLAWLNGFGGAITSDDGMQPALRSTAVISSLNLLRELSVAAPPEQHGYVDGQELFCADEVAMAIDGLWALDEYLAVSDTLEMAVAPLPRVPATGRLAASAVGGRYLMLHSDVSGEHLVYARSFAAFLTSLDVQTRLARSLRRLPALYAALQVPTVVEDEVLGVAVQQVETASGLPPTRATYCALVAIETYLPLWLDEKGEMSQQDVAAGMQEHAMRCMSGEQENDTAIEQ